MRALAPAALLALLLLTAGCATHADPKMRCGVPSDRAPVLGASFKLGFGDRATIAGEAFSLTFERVIAESRCPLGVKCIWEGNARVAIKAERASAPSASLELNTSGRDEKVATYDGYRVELLDVQPYPEQGRATEPSDYCIELKVTKTGA